MSIKNPLVSIVVPVLNEERYLRNCLQSLYNLDYPSQSLEIIVVDNGSCDNSMNIAKEYPVKIFEKPGVKVGAVRNYGASKAKGVIIVFLDSDCVVEPHWLSEGINKMELKQKATIGGQCLIRENPSWIEKYWVLNSSREIIHEKNLLGSCIFIRREVLNNIGQFDESLNSGEDNELSERLRKEGYSVEIDPSLSVVHLGYPTTIKGFIRRQAWHSVDCVAQLPHSFRDKIFLLSIAYTLGIFGLFLWPFFGVKFLALFLGFVLLPPAIISIKRIYRSKAEIRFYEFFYIYFIDILYLTGRAIGIVNGMKAFFLPKSNKKISKA
ncbi:glycosyltransferase involved in cell wall biosynthesis [Methylohalomonas lacus]|uniref:Glycosyltransferase involved in cell wall biosynthesis n=1 Tax=Methylohalomonas lacus TaxID=398773 RepID=A0AAE3HN61_9GAMM|nr:glycosyltransferase [Methylohalomonas lacus]MCS3904327.1 glycosyltransferase involved in cell wall biosynthesis [Methylohalomonas lacus]